MVKASVFLTMLAAAGFAIATTSARAEVRVLFQEGAPKDRFEIRNTGGCPLGPMTLTLDLTASAGGLIFDTAAEGPGVQVYQPLEVVQGAALLRDLPSVQDGGRSIALILRDLLPREGVAFTIDVDDTLTLSPLGQTQVAGSEIKGAAVAIAFDGAALPPIQAQFDRNAVAVLPVSNCIS
ncbi:hypothetical protein [Pelagibius sp.]|uniref:hypothetical protein n=1 Tax=Pelagibius sp. TaxID=1931238 RepID=UPI003BAEB0C0